LSSPWLSPSDLSPLSVNCCSCDSDEPVKSHHTHKDPLRPPKPTLVSTGVIIHHLSHPLLPLAPSRIAISLPSPAPPPARLIPLLLTCPLLQQLVLVDAPTHHRILTAFFPFPLLPFLLSFLLSLPSAFLFFVVRSHLSSICSVLRVFDSIYVCFSPSCCLPDFISSLPPLVLFHPHPSPHPC